MDEKELQLIVYEYELLEKRYEELKVMRENLSVLLKEYKTLQVTVENIKKEQGKEILLPLGTGVYIKTKLNNVDKLYVNVGANVVMTKSINDTIKKIKTEREKIRQEVLRLDEERKTIKKRLKEIAAILGVPRQ